MGRVVADTPTRPPRATAGAPRARAPPAATPIRQSEATQVALRTPPPATPGTPIQPADAGARAGAVHRAIAPPMSATPIRWAGAVSFPQAPTRAGHAPRSRVRRLAITLAPTTLQARRQAQANPVHPAWQRRAWSRPLGPRDAAWDGAPEGFGFESDSIAEETRNPGNLRRGSTANTPARPRIRSRPTVILTPCPDWRFLTLKATALRRGWALSALSAIRRIRVRYCDGSRRDAVRR